MSETQQSDQCGSDTPRRRFDVFISHASEDKDTVVRNLAAELARGGASVWFDEWTLQIGDSLRRTIDAGLRDSRFGVVVLSPSFFAKEWPQAELDALFAREMKGSKVILPIWHNLSRQEVMQFAPLLGERIAARTSEGIDVVAAKLLACIRAEPRPSVAEPKAPAPIQSESNAPVLITDLLQTIDSIAPLCYGLDRPLAGLDAKTYIEGLQQFFHGWNFINRPIDQRLRIAADNLLRTILARGNIHYSLGKLETSAAYLASFLGDGETKEFGKLPAISDVRMGMHEMAADLSIYLGKNKTIPLPDLLVLRVMLPLAEYGQETWSFKTYPLIDANIHRSVRDLLEHLLPQQLNYAMPDRLDRVSNIDLQVACQGQWQNLRDFEQTRESALWQGFWHWLVLRLTKLRARRVTAADLIE